MRIDVGFPAEPVPCPDCGGLPTTDYGAAGFYITSCDECADYAPDAPRPPEGIGRSPNEAIREWNTEIKETRS